MFRLRAVPFKLLLLPVLFCVLCCVSLCSCQSPAVINWNVGCPQNQPNLKLWSQSSTWPNSQLPIVDSSVVISASDTVLLDVVPPQLNSISVRGALVINDINVEIVARWIRVENNGSLLVGSESCLISSSVTFTFLGSAPTSPSNDMGNDLDGLALGSKGMAIMNGAALQMHGTQRSTYTKLSKTINKGESSFQVRGIMDWKSGDKLVVSTSDYRYFQSGGNTYFPDQNEEIEVQSVSYSNGNTLITPKSYTFLYMHFCSATQCSEVALLNRNIVFRGDLSAATNNTGYGGHLMMRAARYVRISNVEFTRCGQAGILGRYPVHFHVMGSQFGTYIKSSIIHHNFQRSLTIHDSLGIVVQNNTAYDTTGHMYFLEDGSEELNTFAYNLGIKARDWEKETARTSTPLIPSDTDAAIFWIVNPNNTYHHNIAVSGQFGYWYSMPPSVNGLSQSKYVGHPRLSYLRHIALLYFQDNEAHSNGRSGLMVDEMQNMDGTIALGSYAPRVLPAPAGVDPSTYDWALPPVWALFANTSSWRNREHGIWIRSSYTQVINALLQDNQNGILCVPGPGIQQNIQIIGESDNIGTENNLMSWLPSYNGRTRPNKWTNNYPVTGWSAYDAGGPQLARDITCTNFQTNNLRPAGCISNLPNGINMLLPQDMLYNFKMINSSVMYLENYPTVYWPEAYYNHDGVKGVNLRDVTGSITGMGPDSWLLSSMGGKFMIGAYENTCVLHNEWHGYACPSWPETFVGLVVNNNNLAATDFGGTDIDLETYTTRASFFRLGSSIANMDYINVTGGNTDSPQRSWYNANVLSRRGYIVRFPHATPPDLNVNILGAALGDWAVVALQYPIGGNDPCAFFSVHRGWNDNILMSCTNSLSTISKDKFYYDTNSQLLYIRIEQTELDYDVYPFNYHTYNSYGSFVHIVAGCTGLGCLPSLPFSIPPALTSREDLYVAYLDPCQTNGYDNTYSALGKAYLFYAPDTHLLSYSIAHNIDPYLNITSVTFEIGGVSFLIALQTLSPIRGAMTLTRNQFIELYKGNVYITIYSQNRPLGILKGRVGCSTASCSAPPPAPLITPCSPPTPSRVLYNGSVALFKYQDWSWGGTQGTVVGSDQTQVLCGTGTLKFQLTSSGALQYYNSLNGVTGLTIDASQYTHLVFWVKASMPLKDRILTLSLNYIDSNSQNQPLSSPVQITSTMIDNWNIDTQWTRVKIPVASLGLVVGVNKPFNLFVFEIYQSWQITDGRQWTMYVDGMIFTQINSESTQAFSGTLFTITQNSCSSAGPYTPSTTSTSIPSSTAGSAPASTTSTPFASVTSSVRTMFSSTGSVQTLSTAAPAALTSIPALLTSKPAALTSVPAVLTSVPAALTSTRPAVTSIPAPMTSVPAALTSKPASLTSTPAVALTSVPAALTSKPAALTSIPAVAQTSTPASLTSTSPALVTSTPQPIVSSTGSNVVVTSTPASISSTPASISSTPAPPSLSSSDVPPVIASSAPATPTVSSTGSAPIVDTTIMLTLQFALDITIVTTQWTQQVRNSISSTFSIDPLRLQIVRYYSGSVFIDFVILPYDPNMYSGQALAAPTIAAGINTQLSSPGSPLLSQPAMATAVSANSQPVVQCSDNTYQSSCPSDKSLIDTVVSTWWILACIAAGGALMLALIIFLSYKIYSNKKATSLHLSNISASHSNTHASTRAHETELTINPLHAMPVASERRW